jgi:hypothetical protein
MSALGLIRPHDWDLPLIVHILGAMILVGALTLSAVSLIAAWRTNSGALTRLGFMTLFYGAIPGWIVMRAGAAWIANKEGLDNSNIDLAWLNFGNAAADGGFLLLIIATVIGGQVVRRIRRDGSPSPIPTRIATGLVSLMLVAYLVAVWAMTTKPV